MLKIVCQQPRPHDNAADNDEVFQQVYDLAVIGAGPAGSLAAAMAASAGLKTVIVEKKSLPRAKICGGFVSARALSLLPADFKLPPEAAEPVYKLSIIKKKKSYSYQSDKILGYLVQRSLFDHLLAAYATQQGAFLLEKSSLKNIVVTKDEAENRSCFTLFFTAGNNLITVKTRYLIAADGALGRCSELGGISRNYRNKICGWGVAELITGKESQNFTSENLVQLQIYPLPFKGGMGWVFHGNGWINRGIGGFTGRKKLFDVHRQLFGEIHENSVPKSWPLPFLGPLCKVAKGNLLMIGDAAGLVEPFSGEGLYNSFRSAAIAVKAVCDAEKTGSVAEFYYNRSFNKHFRQYFLPTLAGAVILHAQTIFFPSMVPQKIARLIENRLWFNPNIN
jgi:geranylgeranyl reductase family protein